MSEAQGTLFEPGFNRSIKVQSSDKRTKSHAGAVLLREMDHQLGLVESLAGDFTDPCDPKKIRYTATELLRERIYALALATEDQDDLEGSAIKQITVFCRHLFDAFCRENLGEWQARLRQKRIHDFMKTVAARVGRIWYSSHEEILLGFRDGVSRRASATCWRQRQLSVNFSRDGQ